MPAKDFFHEALKAALENDGWTITHDPYTMKVEKDEMFVDMGAERIIGATKGTEKIPVELKVL